MSTSTIRGRRNRHSLEAPVRPRALRRSTFLIGLIGATIVAAMIGAGVILDAAGEDHTPQQCVLAAAE